MSEKKGKKASVSNLSSKSDINPTNKFTSLIENLNIEMCSDDESDDTPLDEELHFTTNNSPSPQPQPDIHLHQHEWSIVNDVVLHDMVQSESTTQKSSITQQSTTTTTVQSTAVERSTEKSSLEKSSVEMKGKRKSKKAKPEPISVRCDGSGDGPNNQEGIKSPILIESRVFAKVCVANLRRSFNDLQFNSAGTNSGDEEFNQEKWRSLSLIQLSSSVHQLKSSFSKFDELAKKEQSTEEVVDKEKTCKSCKKQVFLVELMKAEKAAWHRNCFRCTQCSKQLNVDSYSSHEGQLYCKPHFKKLFEPKVVFDKDEIIKPEVIIRESQPTELPPDVARASEKQTTGLEDINIDVRSKFEMFENFKQRQEVVQEPLSIKRSSSVLKRLARYEGKESEVGVPNDELHGEVEDESSDDNNDVIRSEVNRKLVNPAAAMAEIMQCKALEEVRSKWEEGMNSKTEELSEHRKAELNKFRSRLCQGKSNQLKELYENAVVGEINTGNSMTAEIDHLRLESKRLKEMFEKGEIKNEDEEEKKSLVERDSAVFESGVAKQSRSLFQELDLNLAKNFKPPATETPITTGKLNKNLLQQSVDVVRCGESKVEIPVQTEDLTNKFNFFETYEKELENKKNEKKAFRMTPPREPKVNQEEVELYRDPEVIRSETKNEDLIIQKSRTTSKMLNVFRQLEEQTQVKENGPRPLKQFTPPREPARVLEQDSDEEQFKSDESEHEEDNDDEVDEQDAFLKEVGSLARARSLRARFERWESEENERNKAATTDSQLTLANSTNNDESIESARMLKAKFEQIQQQQIIKQEVKVRRFVELTNQSSEMSEECAFCEKKVYAMEKLEANSKVYHKNCFRCSVCKAIMRMDSFTFHHGALYCKNHFKQLFKIKGNYDEGFGHETQKQIFARKQAEKENN